MLALLLLLLPFSVSLLSLRKVSPGQKRLHHLGILATPLLLLGALLTLAALLPSLDLLLLLLATSLGIRMWYRRWMLVEL